MDVLCIGNMCYDIILYLDSFPVENLKQEISELQESGGGPASNAAYLLSKWSVSCAVAGKIGRDSYGEKILNEFSSVGTNTDLIDICDYTPTSLSIILVNRQNGNRTIINRKPAKQPLELDPTILKPINPKILLFDGHELKASLQAMEAFPEAITILDAGSLREGTEILSRKVDYLVCSEAFALAATRLPDLTSHEARLECIRRLNNLNPRTAIVTLGEKGLVYGIDNTYRHIPAFSAKTVDTTAAGDIFHGAFTYGILQNYSLHQSLVFSSMTAAISVTKAGGRVSIPLLEEVMKRLDI